MSVLRRSRCRTPLLSSRQRGLLVLCLVWVGLGIWPHVNGVGRHSVAVSQPGRRGRRGTSIHCGEGGYNGLAGSLPEHEAAAVDSLRLNHRRHGRCRNGGRNFCQGGD